MDNKVSNALAKACKTLSELQIKNGYWPPIMALKAYEPQPLQQPSVLTAQAIRTLALSGNYAYWQNIVKGMGVLIELPIKDDADIVQIATMAIALRLSNTKVAQDQLNKIKKVLIKKQISEGFWPAFPNTNNLTNYNAITALQYLDSPKELTKAKKWLKANKAADGKGWGFNQEVKDSEVSFTANIALALLSCGEDPKSKDIETARKFLLSKQFANGGWPSSRVTYADKATTYGTSMVLLSLLSTGAINKEVEKGIKFLLSLQLENGLWPLCELPSGKGGRYHHLLTGGRHAPCGAVRHCRSG